MPILVAVPAARQESLCQTLAGAGFPDFLTASTAVEVQETLALWDPFAPPSPVDMILIDYGLPGRDVLALCREIRRCDRLNEVSLVLLTEEGVIPDMAATFDAGVTDWVAGEIERPENLARIRRALRLKQVADRRRGEEKEREGELALARRVQRDVLSSPIYSDTIEIDAAYVPSQSLSGDMYYWCEISPGRYGVLLMDVMGHGLSASLVCMALRTVMHALVTRVIDPVVVVEELERHVRLLRPHSATVLYLVIDTVAGTVEYANAGHPPGLVLQASGRIDQMERTALPLGFELPGRPGKRTLSLEIPARIVLYTDGLVEEKGQSIRVGIQRLREQLVALSRQGTHQFIASTVMGFDKLLHASDDVTLITISVRGPSVPLIP